MASIDTPGCRIGPETERGRGPLSTRQAIRLLGILASKLASRRQARSTRVLLALGLIAPLLFLAGYNLENYPTTWFDEGSHLHVPKTLVQYGMYADLSSEGFRYFGPTTGVGPTVMLPIALVFRLAGIGLLQARMVMVAYLLLALLLFVLVSRSRYGWATALLASLLLVGSPGVDLLYLGRQVLGEVPALAFLMLGVLLWWRSTEAGSNYLLTLIGAGFSLGLAAITKNQYALVLVPALLMMMALDRFYYRRQLGLRYYLVPLIMIAGAVGVGYAVQLLPLLGTHGIDQSLGLLRDASAGAIFVFSPSRVLSNLKFLAGQEVFAHWGVPALVYGVALARERSLAGLQQALLVTFVSLGLLWFAFGSIGWPRYAFAPLAITAIFAARLLRDLLQLLWFGALSPGGSRHDLARPIAAAFAAVVILIIFLPLANQAREVATAKDRTPQQVAAYLKENVAASEVVESWEPELGFLTDHQYHYPPSGWLDRSVRARWLGSDTLISGYDPISEAAPAYLVVGPFGKYTGIYSGFLTAATPVKMTAIGEYDIYRLW